MYFHTMHQYSILLSHHCCARREKRYVSRVCIVTCTRTNIQSQLSSFFKEMMMIRFFGNNRGIELHWNMSRKGIKYLCSNTIKVISLLIYKNHDTEINVQQKVRSKKQKQRMQISSKYI